MGNTGTEQRMEVSLCLPCPQRAPGLSMAGRGRGRGRGQMTFNVEAVGIGKGDALPPPTLQPSPLFPVSPPGGLGVRRPLGR